MLHARADARLRAILRLDRLVDAVLPLALPIGEIAGPGRAGPNDMSLTLVGPIAADPSLLTVQQLPEHPAVGRVGRGRHHRVEHFALGIDTDMHLPKCHCLPSSAGASAGSRLPSAFFVELGAAMIVASTIVTLDSRNPRFRSTRLTSSKILTPSWCASSRWRKRITLVSSGTGSCPGRCLRTSTSSTSRTAPLPPPGSDRSNHSCRQWMRSFRSRPTGGRRPALVDLGSTARLCTRIRPRHHRVHLGQKLPTPRRLAKPFEIARRQGRPLFHRPTSRYSLLPESVSITYAQPPRFCGVSQDAAYPGTNSHGYGTEI